MDQKGYSWWRGLVAVLLLHVWTSWSYSWSDGSWAGSFVHVHPDLLLLLATGCVLGLRAGFRWFVGHAIVLVLIWITVLRLAESVVVAHHGRELDLYEDFVHTAGGLWIYLTGDTMSGSLVSWAGRIGVCLGLLTVWWVLYLAVRSVLRCAAQPRGAIGLLAVCQFAVVTLWIEGSGYRSPHSDLFCDSEVRRTGSHLGNVWATAPWHDAEAIADRWARAKMEREESSTDLARLKGAHVVVYFVESYGRVLFTHEESRNRLAPHCARLSKTLKERGFASCTAYASSPSAGSNSHVAHADFLSGIAIQNSSQIDVLLETDVMTMPRYFNAAGYQTINAQPKLMIEWPEGRRFYGFAQDFFGKHVKYAGTVYHWAQSPDQFFLQTALERVIRPSKKPVFMQFISVISHAPFSMIPPYHEDWSVAADTSRYEPTKRYDLDNWNYLQRPEHQKALAETIVYSLETAVGLAEELASSGSGVMLIVLGDHQPPALTREWKTYDVPIHIVSNRPELLAPFQSRGFVDGLMPRLGDDEKSFAMNRFLPRLLLDFSTK